MAKIEKKKFGGLQAQKFQYDIDVISAAGMPPGTNVYVFLTRGPKVAMTKETTTDENGQAMWGERLSLMCTMYRSGNGKYQEKMAKLCCKDKKNRKTIGEIRMNLGDLTGENLSQNITYQLQPSGLSKKNSSASEGEMGQLTVTINCKFIAPNVDDAPSDMSDLDNSSQLSFGTDVGSDEEAPEPKLVDGAQYTTARSRNNSVNSPAVAQADQANKERIAKLEDQLLEQEELISDLRRQNTDLNIAASGNNNQEKAASGDLEEARQEILRLQTAQRDLIQSESIAMENVASLKEQLMQVQLELEKAQRERVALEAKANLEGQAQQERAEELERELEKASFENQRARTEAESTQAALLQQLEEAKAGSVGDSDERVSEKDEEGGVALSKHLHEMLEMRGQELDEAKKRLQNFKEKARESQEECDRLRLDNERLSSELEQTEQAKHAADKQVGELEQSLVEQKTQMQQEQDQLKKRLTEVERAPKEAATSAGGNVDAETQEHIARIEGMLIEAKMAWAQAEEDKAVAELKSRQLKDQLNKGRELNLQFAKRMTKLEVKLSKAKEGKTKAK